MLLNPKVEHEKKIVFQHYYKNSILLCSDPYHSRWDERLGTLTVPFSYLSALVVQIHPAPLKECSPPRGP